MEERDGERRHLEFRVPTRFKTKWRLPMNRSHEFKATLNGLLIRGRFEFVGALRFLVPMRGLQPVAAAQ
jgi:hypothetical protein